MKMTDVPGGQMACLKIGSAADLANAISQMTHATIEKYARHDGMESCQIAAAATLGAALQLALLICKKPDDLKVGQVPKERASEIFRSIRLELVIFAHLTAAHQYEEMKGYDQDHMALVAEFGPKVFGRALAQWQKLYPQLNIEDYLEPPVVQIARDALNNPENHLYDQEKIKDVPSAFIMRNNGSIN